MHVALWFIGLGMLLAPCVVACVGTRRKDSMSGNPQEPNAADALPRPRSMR
jgi:hypothetical protein